MMVLKRPNFYTNDKVEKKQLFSRFAGQLGLAKKLIFNNTVLHKIQNKLYFKQLRWE